MNVRVKQNSGGQKHPLCCTGLIGDGTAWLVGVETGLMQTDRTQDRGQTGWRLGWAWVGHTAFTYTLLPT